MSITSNFVPNELVTCDDRDRYIKNFIVTINDFHKNVCFAFQNMDNLFMFKNLQNLLIKSIHTA